MNTSKSILSSRLSLRVQLLAALSAIIAAVALPELFHVIGDVSGLGTSLGEAFLPMQLPIILAGILAGPAVGAFAGICSPLVSFAISGMPGAAILPFMMIELCVYGLSAGLLANVKMPTTLKVLSVQVAGRAVRALAILASVYAFGNTAVSVSVIVGSVVTGLFGIALQLVLIPLIVYRVDALKKYEN